MSRFLLVSLLLAACSRPEAPAEGTAPTPGKPTVLQAKGSDTMVNLVQRLSEEYSKDHPTVIVAVTGGGSGTGVKALIDGTTDIATASRAMTPEEVTLAEGKGVHPVETVVAFDGLSIYVNTVNPIASIDFDKLKCDQAVKVVFKATEGGPALPVFTPA